MGYRGYCENCGDYTTGFYPRARGVTPFKDRKKRRLCANCWMSLQAKNREEAKRNVKKEN